MIKSYIKEKHYMLVPDQRKIAKMRQFTLEIAIFISFARFPIHCFF